MSAHKLHPLAAAVIIASCSLASTASHAEQNPVEEAILVEGTRTQNDVQSVKFTAPLVDAPQTISVIPEKVFSQQGAQNLTDVLRNTPGISFQAGENGFASSTNNFQMRGFDTTGSIFVNGIRDSGNQTRDIFNLEQVEVAKGAASENGRSGPSGYVNLVTKAPKLDNFNQASLSYGSDAYKSKDRLRATLDTNHQLSESIALRVNVMAQEGGVAGRETAEQRAAGFAPSVAFGLGTDTRVVLGYQYSEDNSRPDFGVPAGLIKNLSMYDATSNSRQDVYNPIFSKKDRSNYYGLDSDYDKSRGHLFTANIEHDINDALSFSNQLGWVDTTREARYAVIMPPCLTGTQRGCNGATTATGDFRSALQFYDRNNTTLSNLSNFLVKFSTGDVAHTVSTGVDFSKEVSRAHRPTTTVTMPDSSLIDPDASRLGKITPNRGFKNRVEIDTVAAYVYDTLKFNEQWQLTGGVRIEHYKAKIEDADPASSMNNYKVSDTTYSGKLGVVFKPLENGSIYASTALAALPPGSWLSNPDISRGGDSAFPGSAGQANNKAKTQRSLNYELGTKWEFFQKRLSLNGALFQTERRNVGIVGRTKADAQATPAIDTALVGYSKQIVRGIELGASGQITEGWDIFAGMAYMQSKREMSQRVDSLYCYGARTVAECDNGSYSINGDELAFTPKLTANIWTTYTFPIGITLGGGAQYVGKAYVGRPDNADRIIPTDRAGEMPSYTVLNAMASYAVSDSFTVRLNINNLTDELYAKSVNWGGGRVDLGESRSWLLSADFSF